jgi:hypothetical protein
MLTNTAVFDPETVSLLSAVLDQAIAALPPGGRSQERKTLLASKLLSAASTGERDPVRLRAAALALLWQISGVTGDFGFPNQVCSDS